MYHRAVKYPDPAFPVCVSRVKGAGRLVCAHYHNAPELMLVVSGTLNLCVGDRSYVCTQQDLIFIPPNSLHYASSEDATTELCAVIFEPSLILREDLNILPQKLFGQYINDCYLLPSTHSCSKALHQSIVTIASLYDGGLSNTADKLVTLSQLYAITAVLSNGLPACRSDPHARKRIIPVLDFIEKNYHRTIHLQELSDILHVCDNHLIRVFKSATGLTPAKYILDLRLKQAMHLLISTELSVADISEAVGFSNANFMAKVFKENTMMSPREYRRAHE